MAAAFCGNLPSGPVCDPWFKVKPFKESLPTATKCSSEPRALCLSKARTDWTRQTPDPRSQSAPLIGTEIGQLMTSQLLGVGPGCRDSGKKGWGRERPTEAHVDRSGFISDFWDPVPVWPRCPPLPVLSCLRTGRPAPPHLPLTSQHNVFNLNLRGLLF
jgi:hypothetical protein